jgi:hypothetical protein
VPRHVAMKPVGERDRSAATAGGPLGPLLMGPVLQLMRDRPANLTSPVPAPITPVHARGPMYLTSLAVPPSVVLTRGTKHHSDELVSPRQVASPRRDARSRKFYQAFNHKAIDRAPPPVIGARLHLADDGDQRDESIGSRLNDNDAPTPTPRP